MATARSRIAAYPAMQVAGGDFERGTATGCSLCETLAKDTAKIPGVRHERRRRSERSYR